MRGQHARRSGPPKHRKERAWQALVWRVIARYGLLVHDRQVARRERIEARAVVEDITAWRRLHHLSRREIAYRMGTTAFHVWRFERGGEHMHMSTLRRYALAVGVLINYKILVPQEQQ